MKLKLQILLSHIIKNYVLQFIAAINYCLYVKNDMFIEKLAKIC